MKYFNGILISVAIVEDHVPRRGPDCLIHVAVQGLDLTRLELMLTGRRHSIHAYGALITDNLKGAHYGYRSITLVRYVDFQILVKYSEQTAACLERKNLLNG
jgi:hypothetical protein